MNKPIGTFYHTVDKDKTDNSFLQYSYDIWSCGDECDCTQPKIYALYKIEDKKFYSLKLLWEGSYTTYSYEYPNLYAQQLREINAAVQYLGIELNGQVTYGLIKPSIPM